MKLKRPAKGFSLLDVLVALVGLALVLGPLLGVLSAAQEAAARLGVVAQERAWAELRAQVLAHGVASDANVPVGGLYASMAAGRAAPVLVRTELEAVAGHPRLVLVSSQDAASGLHAAGWEYVRVPPVGPVSGVGPGTPVYRPPERPVPPK